MLAGCATQTDVVYAVQPRAAFDLNCPPAEIRVTSVSGDVEAGTYHAKGCGLEADYFVRCRDRMANRCVIEAAHVED
jgi:hypothetical protein